MTCGILFGSPKVSMSSEPSGCSETSSTRKEKWSETKHDWLHKVTVNKKIDQLPEATYIHQSKYIKELLKKFNMLECTTAKTPMHPTCILEKEEVSGKVCQKLYRGMIC